jgi:predicted dehydrogenase
MAVKVAVVGVGGIGAEHLKHLCESEKADLVAVCDIIQANADKAAENYGAKAYTNFDEMLEKEPLDAIFLCIPPFAHGDMEEKVAAKGISLFVEKPVGLDLETVRRKQQVLEKSGIIVGTGYCLRYLDTVAQAKEYLKDKKVAMVRAHRFGGLVPVPWWRDITKSGGQLVEQTTHNLDLIRYIAGDIVKISADMALRVMDDVENINIPDVYSVNFVLESGAVGHLDTSFVDQPDGRSSLEVIGRGWRVSIDGSALTIMENGKTMTIKSTMNFYKAQDEAFLEAIITGDRSLILAPYEEGIKTLEATLAAHQSADSGESVRIRAQAVKV